MTRYVYQDNLQLLDFIATLYDNGFIETSREKVSDGYIYTFKNDIATVILEPFFP